MREILFRCSSIGKLMTDPRTKSEGILSVGAKTHIRTQAAQEIFSVEFEITGKELEKGIIVEDDGVSLLNRVRGLNLSKNTELRKNGWISGTCDLFDAPRRRGHDLKCPWSFATFPIALADCYDNLYEWQMRGYMWLWDANEWEVNYALVNTPEHLIRYEPASMHFVDHVPEHMRLTTWLVTRDAAKEKAMAERVDAARDYYAEVIEEFSRTHAAGDMPAILRPAESSIPKVFIATTTVQPTSKVALPDLF